MAMSTFKREYIECNCTCSEHVIRLTSRPEEKELYIDVQLQPNKFLKRLWLGLKYIFGAKSPYGMGGYWDETMIDEIQLARLFTFLENHSRNSGIAARTGSVRINKALDETINDGKQNTAMPKHHPKKNLLDKLNKKNGT